jgi:hypothetical protein
MTTDPRRAPSTTVAAALLIGALVACAAPGEADVASDTAVAAASSPRASMSIAPALEPTVRATGTPAPTPAPTLIAAAPVRPSSLAHIAFGTDRPDINMKMTGRATGVDALEGLVPADARETVAAQLTDAARFSFAGPLDGANPRASYAQFVTYALRYATRAEARAAYHAIVGALDAGDEWQASDTGDGLGTESWAARRDGDTGRDIGYVWQRSNLVLAILGLDDSDRAAVRDTARRMDERAS